MWPGTLTPRFIAWTMPYAPHGTLVPGHGSGWSDRLRGFAHRSRFEEVELAGNDDGVGAEVERAAKEFLS
jgi:hypothetical protein